MPPIQQAQIPTLVQLYATGKLSTTAAPALFAASSTLNNKIGLIRADITTLELKNGAIVNAANRRLLGGGGVDGAIHHAAGPNLLRESRKLHGCETGQSKITDAYNIPCKKIIHAVGPVYDMEGKPQELLTSCYRTSLQLAVDSGLNAVAFSAISTGIYGYPSAKAARTALMAVRKFLETNDGQKLDLVVFCNFEKKDEDAYHELLPLYFPAGDSHPGSAPEKDTNPEATSSKSDAKADITAPGDGARVEVTTSKDGAEVKAVSPKDNVEVAVSKDGAKVALKGGAEVMATDHKDDTGKAGSVIAKIEAPPSENDSGKPGTPDTIEDADWVRV